MTPRPLRILILCTGDRAWNFLYTLWLWRSLILSPRSIRLIPILWVARLISGRKNTYVLHAFYMTHPSCMCHSEENLLSPKTAKLEWVLPVSKTIQVVVWPIAVEYFKIIIYDASATAAAEAGDNRCIPSTELPMPRFIIPWTIHSLTSFSPKYATPSNQRTEGISPCDSSLQQCCKSHWANGNHTKEGSVCKS